MKKYLLSAAVIITFLFYSYTIRKNTAPPDLLTTPVTPGSDSGTPASAPTSVPTTAPVMTGTATRAPAPTPAAPAGMYKNGTYTGNVADAYYGNIQVSAVIQNGKLTAVEILQYPNDRSRSVAINTRALPILQSEAIQVQSASVDMVSGATDTSRAFISSLGSALQKAKN
jgi:uncharacterized protein with FMN-binding domain